MRTVPTWTHILDTAASQMRHGWMLIPITVVLTLVMIRIGLLRSAFIAIVLLGVVLARKYRVTIDRRTDQPEDGGN